MVAPTTGQVVLDGLPLIVEPGSYIKGQDPLYGKPPLRLDSPINLSPVSTFRQATWRGGMGQEHWNDPEMYYLGDADTRYGWAQCAFRFSHTRASEHGDGYQRNSAKLMELRPTGPGDPVTLYTANSNGTTLFKHPLLSRTPDVVWRPPSPNRITAIGRSFYGGQYGLHIGTLNGDLYAIPSLKNHVEKKPRVTTVNSEITFLDSLGARGDIAGTANGKLWKTTTGSWVKIADLDMPVYDGEQWNQRMWVIGHDRASRSVLYATDTVTTQEVFRWPAAFVAQKIVLHSGQLFILGYTFDDGFTTRVGQIWSYNGSSMRLVFELPDEIWRVLNSTNNAFVAAVAYRKWLAFGMPHKGVWFFDPEQDAFHPGPQPDFNRTFSRPVTDDFVAALVDTGGRLVMLQRNSPYLFFEGDQKVYIPSYLITSEYDADLPGQLKTWVRARIRLQEPLPVGASVQLLYTTQHVEDDKPSGPEWRHLATFSTPGKTQFSAEVPSSEAISSEAIRFQLKLIPSPPGGIVFSGGHPLPVFRNADNRTPRVKALEADYLVVADTKWSWSFRAEGATDLVRPDGQPYQFTTAAELQDALEATMRNSNKRWVNFVDKDGKAYKVQVLSMQFFQEVIDSSSAEPNSVTVALSLGEV